MPSIQRNLGLPAGILVTVRETGDHETSRLLQFSTWPTWSLAATVNFLHLCMTPKGSNPKLSQPDPRRGGALIPIGRLVKT